MRIRVSLGESCQQRSIKCTYRPQLKLILNGCDAKQKVNNDARPVGARRPRYAARGEVAWEGDGVDGSELIDELKETSGDGLLNGST